MRAIWPDCVKTLGDRFSYASPGIIRMSTSASRSTSQAACTDGNCVSAQIERNLKLLADKDKDPNKRVPARERLMALAFLVHFIGDLHQPFHAGDRGDRGGNDFKASYGVIAGRTNLHSIWDGWLAERGDLRRRRPGRRGIRRRTSAADERAAMRARHGRGLGPRELGGGARIRLWQPSMADPCGPIAGRAAGARRGDRAAADPDRPPPGRPRRGQAGEAAGRGFRLTPPLDLDGGARSMVEG